MGVRTRTRAWCSGLLASGLVLCGSLTATPAAYATVPRTETAVASGSPITSVVESEVALRLPLPLSAGPHPAGGFCSPRTSARS